MWGALIGDCIGSFWEFSGNKDTAIPLWVPACRFTDDSVCTAAIAAWLTHRDGEGVSLEELLHRRAKIHLGAGFGDRMVAWALSEVPKPYGSWGNGAAMRVSPIALVAQSDDEALRLAEESTAPTHNHPESVRGAQATVLAIRHAFLHRDPQALLAFIEGRFGYDGLTQRRHEEERASHVFDVSCAGTVPLALIIAAHAGSFDETMRQCCSMGGDADTLAAIAGPVAEALYGIPRQHLENARRRYHPEDDIFEAVEALYALPEAHVQLQHWGRAAGTIIAETDHRRVPRLGERLSDLNQHRQAKP